MINDDNSLMFKKERFQSMGKEKKKRERKGRQAKRNKMKARE